jgi:hypothetical protein
MADGREPIQIRRVIVPAQGAQELDPAPPESLVCARNQPFPAHKPGTCNQALRRLVFQAIIELGRESVRIADAVARTVIGRAHANHLEHSILIPERIG